MTILEQRSRSLNSKPIRLGPVVYWMNREMRIEDNWALLYGQQLAQEMRQPFVIIFSLFEAFGVAKNHDQDPMFNRMKLGLKKVRNDAKKHGLAFYILHGPTVDRLSQFCEEVQAGVFITDFSPLRPMRILRQQIAERISIAFKEVDGHNIVPVHIASQKQEWGAYTLRPKIHRLLDTFLIPYSALIKSQRFDYQGQHDERFLDAIPGELDVETAVQTWFHQRLDQYEKRNDPTIDATSRLSSYFHFGHLSSQTIALKVKATKKNHEAFLEELIVRKELADNFCFYNPHYDQVKGFPDWAIKTLNLHRQDRREYVYTRAQLQQGLTHDDAWNAAQLQMVKTGYMHGYMRMYWAKKILEWTPDPETALAYANYLNDTFEMDGRDPNGYTGTAWAIGGVHDRPWQERPIFGMIRYMNAAGLKRKFDVGTYIRQWLPPKKG